MRVLIACEFSGVVRDAFIRQGHEAWSCDNAEDPEGEYPGCHIAGNCLDFIGGGWDLMIAHPPCTYLASSGARWWKERLPQQEIALNFVRALMAAPIPRIAIENPVGCISRLIRRPDQIVQPYDFGHNDHKATCLWLKNLPLLKPTKHVWATATTIHHMSPSASRSKDRSRTFTGFAEAMASQWGVLLP